MSPNSGGEDDASQGERAATGSGAASRIRALLNWRVLGFLALTTAGFVVPYLQQRFVTFLVAEMFIFAIVALGYNILLGYTGLLSFGHAAFFGSAGYTVGLLLEYTDVQSFLLLAGSALVVVFVLAVIMGYISVRHTGVYYALLMLALAQVIFLMVSKNYSIANGTDGLRVSAPTLLGVNYVEQLGYNLYHQFILYFIILATFVAVVALLYRILSSPFGLTLETVRENPERAAAIGIPVKRYRWYASTLSGVTVGVGGLLYAFLIGRVTPGATLNWTLSGEIAFMTILGGPTTFFGPAVGAAVFILLRTYILSTVPDAWLFVLGTVLYVVVVFFPTGIYGTLRATVSSVRRHGIKQTIRSTRVGSLTPESSGSSATQRGD